MAVDANGYPIDFEITRGKIHDSQIAPKLIELVEKAEYLVADKGYDSEKIRECARTFDMTPENLTALKVIKNLMVIYIDYGIWLKVHLHVQNTFE